MRGMMVSAVAFTAGLLAWQGTGVAAEESDARYARSVATAAAEHPEADDTWKLVLPSNGVQGVLGREVTSSAGEHLGRIVQVLVNQNGQVRAAVIDFGGFLGVGSRKVVVDWGALHFLRTDDREHITLDLTRDQIKAAPEYKDGKPVVVLGALSPPPPDM
jgi:hypothetical protein